MDVGLKTQAAMSAYTAGKVQEGKQQTGKTKAADKAGAALAADKAEKADKAAAAESAKAYGRTVGAPKLSEAGAKYYEQLKAKYGNMDFILVAKDQVENAKKNVGSYANGQKMAVLIDEEKIERMATDEEYRKKYEGIISMAQTDLKAASEKFAGMSSVKGFGMEVGENGPAGFFAVVKKNADANTAKLKEKQEAKKAEKKAEAKKAEKKAAKEKLEKKRAERAEAQKADDEEDVEIDDEEYEIITASSLEELMRLVEEHDFALRSDSVRTPEEEVVGGSIDFKL